jgi:catechol 2,3-dioxygenase-like lactoylglutathione lyase family enzyme
MDQRVSVVTLGVADLARARSFYRDGLGWREGKGSSEHIVFFDMNGLVLALFPREQLAEDAKLDPAGSGFGGFTLAHCVRSMAEVDEALALAERAGARILKPAQDAFWGGYSGYFADLDGNPWEVAWNPHWTLGVDGRIAL